MGSGMQDAICLPLQLPGKKEGFSPSDFAVIFQAWKLEFYSLKLREKRIGLESAKYIIGKEKRRIKSLTNGELA